MLRKVGLGLVVGCLLSTTVFAGDVVVSDVKPGSQHLKDFVMDMYLDSYATNIDGVADMTIEMSGETTATLGMRGVLNGQGYRNHGGVSSFDIRGNMSYLGGSETASLEAIIDESKSPNIVYSKVDGADWIVEELGLTEDEIVSKIEEFFGDENWDIASKYLDKYVEDIGVGYRWRIDKGSLDEFIKEYAGKEEIEELDDFPIDMSNVLLEMIISYDNTGYTGISFEVLPKDGSELVFDGEAFKVPGSDVFINELKLAMTVDRTAEEPVISLPDVDIPINVEEVSPNVVDDIIGNIGSVEILGNNGGESEQEEPSSGENLGCYSSNWDKTIFLNKFGKIDDIEYDSDGYIFGRTSEYVYEYPSISISLYDWDGYELGDASKDIIEERGYREDYFEENPKASSSVSEVGKMLDRYGNPVYSYTYEYQDKEGGYAVKYYRANIEMPESGYIHLEVSAQNDIGVESELTDDFISEFLNALSIN